MPEALTPEGRVLFAEDAHPLVVFAMSLAHPADTARIVAEEEEAASALIGAIPCGESHEFALSIGFPCWKCRAAV